ncbi:helix-turn-helix domain-containing protein [Streptomyces sp. M92]|nr:helix-turn-helix domain-containing protein [Streptomyces sp. M92]
MAKARKAKGESVSAIAKALGISRATLYRHIG